MARFSGSDYIPSRDDVRLDPQLDRIRALMLDGKFRTLAEIARKTKSPAPSVSAQLRHLRKKQHGGYIVEKRYLGDGLFEYRVVARGLFDAPIAAAA